MGIDHDLALLHQRRHADAVARVIREDEEGGGVGNQAAMQRDAVGDGRHAEFADAVVTVVAAFAAGDTLAALDQGKVGAGEVGRAAEQFRQGRRKGSEGVLRGLAGGDVFGLFTAGGDISGLGRFPGARQFPPHDAALEFAGFGGKGGLVGGEAVAPVLFEESAARLPVPGGIHVGRDLERSVRPADVFAGAGDFAAAQRRAVAIVAALLVRRAAADGRLAADQAGLVGDRLGGEYGKLDGVAVMAVYVGDDVPAVGLETLRRVVGEPAFDMAVDGDAIVVPEGDQLAQAKGAGERAGLVRDAFHQAAVAEKGVGVVIDDLVAGPVELGGQHLLGERHADRIGDALAERAGGRFDADCNAIFRVPGGLRVKLAEVLQVVDREIVAGQVEERIKQHRTVAVRQHEAIAVRPLRVGRVVA